MRSLEISAICTEKTKWSRQRKGNRLDFCLPGLCRLGSQRAVEDRRLRTVIPPGLLDYITFFDYCTYDTNICLCTDFFCLPCVFVSYAYEIYRNFIPCACNLCVHPCFVGFGDVIFYDYLHTKMCSFPGESSMQIWSKILSKKKADLYQIGSTE